MVEIPRPEANEGLSCRRRPASRLVFVQNTNKCLDSGMRRNDGKGSRRWVDSFGNPSAL